MKKLYALLATAVLMLVVQIPIAKANEVGAAPGLIVTSYDWSRKRVIPNKPYTGWIELQNTGTKTIVIQSVSGSNPNFNVDLSQFMNLAIQPGEDNKKIFPVEFMPISTGNHSLTLTFVTNTQGEVATAVLSGTGIIGRLRTYDINFDSTMVGSLAVSRRQLKIECVPWEFQDSVLITDLQVSSGSINPDLKSFSTDGFRYDKQIVRLPIQLQPGQSIVVDKCEFLAPHYGDFSADLTTVSNAESDVTSHWNGVGVSDFVPSKSLVATGGETGEVPLGSEGIIICTILNTGNEAFFIDSIALDTEPQFTILQPKNPKVGFPLQYTPVAIQISYKPTTAGTSMTRLHIYSSELGRDTSVAVIGSTGNVNSVSSNSTSDKNENMMTISPNPLGAAGGTVQFKIPRKALTELSLYNTMGAKTAIIMEGLLDAGDYSMKIPVENLTSGTYVLRMISGSYKQELQLVVVK